MTEYRYRKVWILLLLLVSGCNGTPLAPFNPVIRDQWAHDEKFGPTVHTKVKELVDLQNAAAKLSPAEQEENSQLLLRIFRDEPSTQITCHAVLALAEFPTGASLEGLRLASEHSDSDVRIAACRGWQRKKSAEALEALARILGSDTDLDVRMAAADALRDFRDPQAIAALGVALDDNDPALQYRAIESLKKVSGRDLGNHASAWKQMIQDRQIEPNPNPSLADRIRAWF